MTHSKRSRRQFLKNRGVALTALSIHGVQLSCNKKTDRPNILWITSEDNSPFLCCYGDKLADTPHLDKLAAQGILYKNGFATAPVCAPARNSIITGMYPTSLGTQHMRSSNAVPDFIGFSPTYLGESGYFCTNNSKTDYNTASADPEEIWDECSKKAHYKNRTVGQPFFAIFNLTSSHESSIHKWEDNLQRDPQKMKLPAYHPDTPEIRHDWAQYYDKITAMDAKVGNILRELEEAGLAEDTIVFYYADHGGVLARSKRFMYESGLHVPFIIRFPQKYQHLAPGKPGEKTDRLVSFVDLAPTLLSLAGIPVPDYMQGRAFLGKFQTKPAIRELEKLLSDISPDVRITAAEALCVLGERAALTTIIEILKHKNSKVVLRAVNSLEYLGKTAKPAVPTIKTICLNHKDNYVRRAAKHAVEIIITS